VARLDRLQRQPQLRRNAVRTGLGHLALAQPALLAQSPFLLALGLAVLLAYLHLGWRYWFSVPFRGIALATLLYVAGLVDLLLF
jgi:hypothetical protein